MNLVTTLTLNCEWIFEMLKLQDRIFIETSEMLQVGIYGLMMNKGIFLGSDKIFTFWNSKTTMHMLEPKIVSKVSKVTESERHIVF